MEDAFEYRKPWDSLLSLPNELLVYVFAFLPNARDKLMLQCVSRRLRSVMETPSLWSECVWPYYDSREEHCVNNLLKSCGGYVNRLSFPDHVPSSLLKLLPYCINVVHLNLATTKLDPDQLVMATKHMNRLQTLDIQWNTDLNQFVYIILSMKATSLKELTVRVKTKERELDSIHSSLHSFLYWLTKGVMPMKLIIVCSYYELRTGLIKEWSLCNPKSPSGHNGYVKIYTSLKVPLDLYPALPVFQLQFGQEAALPLLHASKFGLLGFENDLILLTNHCQANTTVYKAKMWKNKSDIQGSKLNSSFNNLDSVIEFDFSYKSLQSDHLEQLAVMCPNLQRLDLSHNTECLKNLQRLHTIAKCCRNLHGLNLFGIHVTEVENHMQLWQILSSMKLTHLTIELCIVLPVKDDGTYRQNLIELYKKCSLLQALHLQSSACRSCNAAIDQDILLISNFPSLTYCMLGQIYQAPLIVQGIATSCKGLKYLNIKSSFPLSLSADVNVSCLQQLCLHSAASSIPDSFMIAVSAHHGLVHVLLCVKLVGYDGIAAVIENSPKLVTFHIIAHISTIEDSTLRPNDLKAVMEKRYSNMRLFNSGSFEVVEFLSHRSKELLEIDIDVTSYLWNL